MMTDKDLRETMPAVLDANQVRDLIDEVLRWRAESRTRTASNACETPCSAASPLSRVLLDVTTERMMQDRKFGADRDIPSVYDTSGCDPGNEERILRLVYDTPSEAGAKGVCEDAFARGCGTWAHILVEEVAEAIAAPDDVARRAELVQCAAVCVAWCENIDRRGAK